MKILSETGFAPNLPHRNFVPNAFVDIAEFIEKNVKLCRSAKAKLLYSLSSTLLRISKLLHFIEEALYNGGKTQVKKVNPNIQKALCFLRRDGE